MSEPTFTERMRTFNGVMIAYDLLRDYISPDLRVKVLDKATEILHGGSIDRVKEMELTTNNNGVKK